MANPTKLLVLDTNCKDKPRFHDQIIEGKLTTFEFLPGKPTEVPFAVGTKFLIDGFVVTDKDGKRYRSKAGVQKESDTALKLQPGEVIANLEELTAEALLIRANQMSGGEKLLRKHGKEAIIAFLVSGAEAPKAKSRSIKVETGDDSDDLIDDEEATEEELERMIPTDPDLAKLNK